MTGKYSQRIGGSDSSNVSSTNKVDWVADLKQKDQNALNGEKPESGETFIHRRCQTKVDVGVGAAFEREQNQTEVVVFGSKNLSSGNAISITLFRRWHNICQRVLLLPLKEHFAR